jgi:hypothetical protein
LTGGIESRGKPVAAEIRLPSSRHDGRRHY